MDTFLEARTPTAPSPIPAERPHARARSILVGIVLAGLVLLGTGGLVLVGTGALVPGAALALAPPTDPGRRLDLALRHLDASSRILYVTAHPDDEDSGLLARLRVADGVRVRLLTLTRGEGGQNEIGTHLSDALGVLRSRELERSAEWLGNEQRFSPAFEFGYSFSVEETFAEWNEDRLLREIVRELRVFRPHVVLTMLLDGPGGGQHHQASARLTLRAFEIAATGTWPELGPPHRAARLYSQIWQDDGGVIDVEVDLGVYDPLLGATYEEYGLRAREAHRCQGMAELHAPLTAARSRWRLAGTEGRALPGPDAPDEPRAPGAPHAPAATAPVARTGFDGLPPRLGEASVGDVHAPAAESDAQDAAAADRGDVNTRAADAGLVGAIEAARKAHEGGATGQVVAELERAWTLLATERGPAETKPSAEPAATARAEAAAAAQADLDERRGRLSEALAGALGLTLHARADRRTVAAGDTLDVAVHAASALPATLRFRTVGPRASAVRGASGGNGGDGSATPDDAFAGASVGPWSDALTLVPGVPGRLALAIPIAAETAPTLPVPVPRRGLATTEVARERGTVDAQVGSYAHPDWSAFAIEPLLRLPGGTEVPLARMAVSHQERDPERPRIFLADPQVVPDPSIRPLAEQIPLPLAPEILAAGAGTADEAADATGTAHGAETVGAMDRADGAGDGRGLVACTWIVSSLAGGAVEVTPILPTGWSAEPRTQRLELRPETEVPVTFVLQAPASRLAEVANVATRTSNDTEATNVAAPTELRAEAAEGPEGAVAIDAEVRDLRTGARSRSGYLRVEYEHVRPGALLVPARTIVRPFPCAVVPDLRIGYVEGSGDGTRTAIERLGYRVVTLDAATLLHGDLAVFDVIVTGVRAYKAREDLAAATPRLRAWMEAGGVLLVQYNKFEFNAEEASSPFAPFPGARVGTGRVTVEDSPVIVPRPDHRVFHHPNPIGPGDWEGWVQERGLYFLDAPGAPYTSLLTLEDPWPYNSGARDGGLVEAEVGAGRWVYLGIGLFRQLPAAVPGAYRLLANLLALGSTEPTRP